MLPQQPAAAPKRVSQQQQSYQQWHDVVFRSMAAAQPTQQSTSAAAATPAAAAAAVAPTVASVANVTTRNILNQLQGNPLAGAIIAQAANFLHAQQQEAAAATAGPSATAVSQTSSSASTPQNDTPSFRPQPFQPIPGMTAAAQAALLQQMMLLQQQQQQQHQQQQQNASFVLPVSLNLPYRTSMMNPMQLFQLMLQKEAFALQLFGKDLPMSLISGLDFFERLRQHRHALGPAALANFQSIGFPVVYDVYMLDNIIDAMKQSQATAVATAEARHATQVALLLRAMQQQQQQRQPQPQPQPQPQQQQQQPQQTLRESMELFKTNLRRLDEEILKITSDDSRYLGMSKDALLKEYLVHAQFVADHREPWLASVEQLYQRKLQMLTTEIESYAGRESELPDRLRGKKDEYEKILSETSLISQVAEALQQGISEQEVGSQLEPFLTSTNLYWMTHVVAAMRNLILSQISSFLNFETDAIKRLAERNSNGITTSPTSPVHAAEATAAAATVVEEIAPSEQNAVVSSDPEPAAAGAAAPSPQETVQEGPSSSPPDSTVSTESGSSEQMDASWTTPKHEALKPGDGSQSRKRPRDEADNSQSQLQPLNQVTAYDWLDLNEPPPDSDDDSDSEDESPLGANASAQFEGDSATASTEPNKRPRFS